LLLCITVGDKRIGTFLLLGKGNVLSDNHFLDSSQGVMNLLALLEEIFDVFDCWN